MFTSASWQCPVCDRPGDRHDQRCLVLEMASVAERRLNGNRRLTKTLGRLRQRIAEQDLALARLDSGAAEEDA